MSTSDNANEATSPTRPRSGKTNRHRSAAKSLLLALAIGATGSLIDTASAIGADDADPMFNGFNNGFNNAFLELRQPSRLR